MKFNLIPETFNKDQDMKSAEVRPRHIGWEKEWRQRFPWQGCTDRGRWVERHKTFEDKGGQIKEGGLKYKKGFK